MTTPNQRAPYTVLDGAFDVLTVGLAVGLCALQREIVACPDDLPTFAGAVAQTTIKGLAFLEAGWFICRGVQISFFNGPSPLHPSSKPKGPMHG
jgi:hypothetical protein